MLAIVRIRGNVGVRKEFRDTMRILRLKTANNCVVVPETPTYKGMARKVKDYVTFGEIRFESFLSMLKKRGRLKGKGSEGGKRLSEKALKDMGYDSVGNLARDLFEGKKEFSEVGIAPTFRLTPPSRGFKSVKKHYPKGDVGHRGEAINDLIERMI